MSAYQACVDKWKGGCGAHYCERANRVVMARGTLPCDILFIGEAPGESEDVLGQPFKGPAGKLLEGIITRALLSYDPTSIENKRYAIGYINILGCIPLDANGKKLSYPNPFEIKKCLPRTYDLIRIARPKIIVRVGEMAKSELPGQKPFEPVDWIPPSNIIYFCDITHPAAIIRSPMASRELAIKRCVARLLEVIDSYELGRVAQNGDYVPF